MTTIILTIIGILLAAAAALMVIFYGGDAFNSGSVGAQANTYQNAGTNVISAAQLAAADAVAFDLTPGRYLKEAPALPNGATGTLEGTAPNISYEVPVAGDQAEEVCARINANLKLDAATVTALETAGNRNGKMGCNSGDSVFFANL